MAKTSKSAGNLAEAQSDLDEALRIFADLGARFEEARALLDLADLAYAQQRPDAVAASLAQAQALFAALDVPKYAERARRFGAEFGVPVAMPVVERATPTL